MCYYPSKHSSWWRDTEDVFNVTFFCLPRRLEGIIARRLEDVLEDILKTPWRRLARRLEDILGRCIANTSWRRLEDVFKRSWKTKSVTLKTSWGRVEDVLENKKCLLGVYLIFLEERSNVKWIPKMQGPETREKKQKMI